MANGFKSDLRLDAGKEVTFMDSCDSAGQSMICGGSKKILTWLNEDFLFSCARGWMSLYDIF